MIPNFNVSKLKESTYINKRLRLNEYLDSFNFPRESEVMVTLHGRFELTINALISVKWGLVGGLDSESFLSFFRNLIAEYVVSQYPIHLSYDDTKKRLFDVPTLILSDAVQQPVPLPYDKTLLDLSPYDKTVPKDFQVMKGDRGYLKLMQARFIYTGIQLPLSYLPNTFPIRDLYLENSDDFGIYDPRLRWGGYWDSSSDTKMAVVTKRIGSQTKKKYYSTVILHKCSNSLCPEVKHPDFSQLARLKVGLYPSAESDIKKDFLLYPLLDKPWKENRPVRGRSNTTLRRSGQFRLCSGRSKLACIEIMGVFGKKKV